MPLESSLPVIDIHDLFEGGAAIAAKGALDTAGAIGNACRDCGFFYISKHGVAEGLQLQLEKLSREFFGLDEKEKMKISMQKGGRAWRGYFPVEGELTSGMPDLKEGIYFGQELDETDGRVKDGLPLHGKNLFPEYPEGLKDAVLQYMNALTQVGHALMKGIALSLELKPDYFFKRYTSDPLILFRIFHYPPQKSTGQWGVGEHTDYGLLTILKQDNAGGLQVKAKGRWIDAPPIPGTFICNIGDMLDRMSGGLYRSTPHRVLNTSGRSRYSFPFFFDPNFQVKIKRIENIETVSDDREQRWDHASVHAFDGTYGDYLLNKVGKVFPELQKKVL